MIPFNWNSSCVKKDRTKMEGIVIASDLPPAVSASKPIKKKVPALHEQEDGDSSSVDSNVNITFSPRDAEAKARKQLRLFLLSKGIEPHLSDDYKVHIKMKKARSSAGIGNGESVGYTVSYSCPMGSILVSKADVLSSIQESRRRQQNSHHKSNNSSAQRSESANDSAKRLEGLELPVVIDGITVLSFGVVDFRPEFHTAVQIYPLGYKCEQTVQVGSLSKGLLLMTVVCEVDELDGGPAFRVTVKGSADVYLASTEALVWKKVGAA